MKKKDDEPLWIPDRDAHGRLVNEKVEAELQNVWKRALAHIESHSHDTSRAAEIMEKTAFTVSRLMKRKVIRNLRSFGLRVFKRKYLKAASEGRSIRFSRKLERARPGGRLYCGLRE